MTIMYTQQRYGPDVLDAIPKFGDGPIHGRSPRSLGTMLSGDTLARRAGNYSGATSALHVKMIINDELHPGRSNVPER